MLLVNAIPKHILKNTDKLYLYRRWTKKKTKMHTKINVEKIVFRYQKIYEKKIYTKKTPPSALL